MSLKESEILEVLKDIETGKLTLKLIENHHAISSGNVVYTVSNGWQITIFKDADNWDYIDNIKTCDGRTIGFNKLDSLPEIKNYYPPKQACLAIYEMDFEKD